MLGTRAFLQEASWARLTEFGEDYAVWLTDYERIKNGGRITVRLRVEVRTPSLLALGSLLERREIHATFQAQDEWGGVRSVAQAIKRQARNSTAAFMVEALHVGEAAYRAVCDIMGREPRITVQRSPGAVPENEPRSSRGRSSVRAESNDGGERSQTEDRLRVASRQGLYVYVAGPERDLERLRGRRLIIKDVQTAAVRGWGRVIAVHSDEITVELQTVRGPGPARNDQVVLVK